MTALYRATTRPPALPAHTPRPWTQLQPVRAQLDHNARPHGNRAATAAYRVQDVLLDEPAVEQLPI
ncbi:hypothetical protein [Mycobacterium xenopi]|uniref:Uncharacterized protein n=2 Tax=Mycobacterium xenopi TaxID=1789 RepID=A0AAD1H2T1_MYCXE|nr:hypothetical protein [Mycobacterium xenopi]BBU23776.1 hypothetical protein MYXE_35660 [Mycobacterium xenopi]